MKNTIIFLILFASRQVLAADMYINPATTYLEAEKTTNLEVIGGTEPFRWIWQDKDGQLHDTNFASEGKRRVSFSAPSDSGIYQIFVKDATDITVESLIFINTSITLTNIEGKNAVYIRPEESFNLITAGGRPPYTLIPEAGTCDNQGNTFVCKSPNIIGDYDVTVRDSIGNTNQAKVYMISELKVTPNIQYMKRGEKVIYEVKGGIPPYTGIILDGDDRNTLEPDMRSENGIFTFTAGNLADKDIIIEFTDSVEQTIQAHAYVQRLLRLTTGTLYAHINSKVKFKVIGGTGGYTAVTDGGIVTIDSETSIGTWHAPRKFGNYEIKISDSSGNSKVFIGKVEPINPVISPSVVTMATGDTKTFMVTRGLSPYNWECEGCLFEAQNENKSVIEVTVPETAGNYNILAVRVRDKNGDMFESTIIVSP
jgi:hypothetical protein